MIPIKCCLKYKTRVQIKKKLSNYTIITKPNLYHNLKKKKKKLLPQ